MADDSEVVLVEADECHAFEFTPFGIRPLNGPPVSTGDKLNPGGAALDLAQRAKPARAVVASPSQKTLGRSTLDPTKPMTGRELMQAAKARIQEIARLLKSVPALQREQAQLQALVLAAGGQTRKRRKAEGIQ